MRQGFYHLILAPGLDWQDIDGVGHADELYLEWDPIFGYHHGLPADDLVVRPIMTYLKIKK